MMIGAFLDILLLMQKFLFCWDPLILCGKITTTLIILFLFIRFTQVVNHMTSPEVIESASKAIIERDNSIVV